jgi:hypothetical protein
VREVKCSLFCETELWAIRSVVSLSVRRGTAFVHFCRGAAERKERAFQQTLCYWMIVNCPALNVIAFLTRRSLALPPYKPIWVSRLIALHKTNAKEQSP